MNALSLVRIVHIAAGAVALLAVAVPLVARKGGKAHRRLGWVFSLGMGTVALTAVPLCIARLSTDVRAALFLAQITALSASSVYLGLRALKARRAGSWTSERAISAAGVATSAAFFAYGASQAAGLFLVFGALGVVQGYQSWTFWADPTRENGRWFLMHMNGMVTAAIAAVTAFAVINAHTLGIPDSLRWVAWVAPGAVGGTGLNFWSAHYRAKFAAQPLRIESAGATIRGESAAGGYR